MSALILETKDLAKMYGDFAAVRGITFSIEEGEIFGLLGPNGAGKSTTIAMLTGLFPPSKGSIRIFGIDPLVEPDRVKKLIGVVPRDLALYPTLSGRENLRFFGEMYGLSGKDLRGRVEMSLEYVAMTERANDPVKTYSGGMKRRINLAAALIHNPRLLFLDEPTVGVDPQSRNHIFEVVELLNKASGVSIIYTTHYMEEAERLCRRIAIIDRGQIIALDTPHNLINMLGGGIIHLGLSQENEALRKEVMEIQEVKNAMYLATENIDDKLKSKTILKIEAHHANEALIAILNLLNQRGEPVLSIETLEPNLESLFLHLTGKALRQ